MYYLNSGAMRSVSKCGFAIKMYKFVQIEDILLMNLNTYKNVI